MEFQIQKADPFVVIVLAGEVDLKFSPKAREQILKYLSRNNHVLVDLSGVSYIDSSGVASLVEGLQYAKKHNLKFALVGASLTALKVLQLARLDQVFTLYDSISDAQNS
jgi:anti-sigma B factor antagonist